MEVGFVRIFLRLVFRDRLHQLCLFLANHRSMGSGCFHFGNYHFFVLFAIGKDVLQVL